MIPRIIGLILVAAVLTLAPAAHASPPDQSWMPGLFDNADFDDVILLVTDNVGMIDPSTVGSMRPVRFVVGRAMPVHAESPPSSVRSPARSRAPPATVPKSSFLDRMREAVRARRLQSPHRDGAPRLDQVAHLLPRQAPFGGDGRAEVTAFLRSDPPSLVGAAVTLALGIGLGVGSTSFRNAMHHVKVTELYKADLVTSDGSGAVSEPSACIDDPS